MQRANHCKRQDNAPHKVSRRLLLLAVNLITRVAAFVDDGRVPLTVRKVSDSAHVHENYIIYMGAYGLCLLRLHSCHWIVVILSFEDHFS